MTLRLLQRGRLRLSEESIRIYRLPSLPVRQLSLPTRLQTSPLIHSAEQNVLIIKKPRDDRVRMAFSDVIRHLKSRYSSARIFVEHTETDNIPSCETFTEGDAEKINLVITLGGDGTILHASSLFREGPVPPVLSFSLGTLGFLLPFDINSFPAAVDSVFMGRATVLPRMRLTSKLRNADREPLANTLETGYQLMNEVTMHRGRNPHLTIIDAFVDGQHLTESVSDGLIVSSPTGSTAYSLSSGGPIVHPSMHALLLTPICPRSLSFRPLVLPGTSRISLTINSKSRAPAEVSMDGHDIRLLHPGESVDVEASPYPIPCVNRFSVQPTTPGDGQSEHQEHPSDGWVKDINRLLHFNVAFRPSVSAARD